MLMLHTSPLGTLLLLHNIHIIHDLPALLMCYYTNYISKVYQERETSIYFTPWKFIKLRFSLQVTVKNVRLGKSQEKSGVEYDCANNLHLPLDQSLCWFLVELYHNFLGPTFWQYRTWREREDFFLSIMIVLISLNIREPDKKNGSWHMFIYFSEGFQKKSSKIVRFKCLSTKVKSLHMRGKNMIFF